MWISRSTSTIYWKDYLIVLLSLLKIISVKPKVCFWTLSYIPLFYMFILMLVSHPFGSCSFIVSFEIGKCKLFNVVLPFQDFLAILVPLHVYKNFRINLLISAKKWAEPVDRSCFNHKISLPKQLVSAIICICELLFFIHFCNFQNPLVCHRSPCMN